MKKEFLDHYYSHQKFNSYTIFHLEEIYDLACLYAKKEISYVDACEYLFDKFHDRKNSIELLDYAIVLISKLH